MDELRHGVADLPEVLDAAVYARENQSSAHLDGMEMDVT